MVLSILLSDYLEEDIMKIELANLLFNITQTVFNKNFQNKYLQIECIFYLYNSLIVFISLSSEIDSFFNLNKFLNQIESIFKFFVEYESLVNLNTKKTLESEKKKIIENKKEIEVDIDFEKNKNNNENEKKQLKNNLDFQEEKKKTSSNFLLKTANPHIEIFIVKTLLFICISIQKTYLLILDKETVDFIIELSLRNFIFFSKEIYENKENLTIILKEAEFGINHYIRPNTDISSNEFSYSSKHIEQAPVRSF